MTRPPLLEVSGTSALTGCEQAPTISTHDSEFVEQVQETEGAPDVSSPETHTGGVEETVITNVRATDVALGLGRLPAGFYTVVQHSGHEWRTENKLVSVNDVVNWSGHIPIPSDLSATICFEVYASFGFQPVLGDGEQLRKLMVTVQQLLDHSAKNLPFTFASEDKDAVSPCLSLLATVGQWGRESVHLLTSRVSEPHCSTTKCPSQLEDVTNHGYSALARYRKHKENGDLEHAIEQFERALNICPLDHPYRAAVQSNMAMAKFIHCQVEDTDCSIDVPLTLYSNVLSARPAGHPDRLCTLVQLAIVHLQKAKIRQSGVDAAQAQALLHEAMDLSSAGSQENRAAHFLLQLHTRPRLDPVHTDCQPTMGQNSTPGLAEESWTIGVQFMCRFQQSGSLPDLQQAIAAFDVFALFTPGWDHRYIGGLANLGVALFLRFQHLGELGDLDQGISRFRRAVDLTPEGHPGKPGFLGNLGNSLLTRFKHAGELDDLKQAILRLADAIDLIPNGRPGRLHLLKDLGDSFFIRFQCLGELSDLEQAVSRFRRAVDLTPEGHPGKPGFLNDLGNSLLARFEYLADLCDLEQGILRLTDAVDLTPQGRHEKPSMLNNLARSHLTRFRHFGELKDLEQVISRYRDAVDLTPDGHVDKPGFLNNLGNSFLSRFERLGKSSDLDQGILKLTNAVDLTPEGCYEKPGFLNNLGNSFLARFRCHGEMSDLEEAILMHKDAVNLTPEGHPGKPGFLNNLSNSLLTRFERLGELHDLEDAISGHMVAVGLIPPGLPDRPKLLNNLASSYFTRFKRLGVLSDLHQAVSKYMDAVDLTPKDHPDRPKRLSNLGSSLLSRFESVGELRDLHEAITMHKDAVDLIPHGHSDKPTYLSNLANSLVTRFGRFGALGDLSQAISMYSDVVRFTPNDNPDQPRHLTNLAVSFITRFERLGELSDLEEAVLRFRDAVDLSPQGHPDRASRLTSLSSSLGARFKVIGELSDLEQAISWHRVAVDITPQGHPRKPHRLSCLANSVLTRFEHLGELSDLEEANAGHSDVVNLIPRGHPDKHTYLNNLANSFLVRFKHLGELSDLEQAVSRFKDAVDDVPEGHSRKSRCLNNLGSSLLTRFEHIGELNDLEQAIFRLRDAVDLLPEGHPDKPSFLNNLANCFLARFEHLGEPGDSEQAISLYSHVACSSIGHIALRFRASRQWISCARILQHRTLLHAYSAAISLLPQLAWIGLSLTQRYQELTQGTDVAREAAAAALSSGHPETAVEWLEQGRSIVWGELYQLRSPYEELSAVHPDHARRLRQLSVTLEHATTAREKASFLLSEEISTAKCLVTESLQQAADRHRGLAIQRDGLLQEIRALPGFERYLLYKEFSQLRASAHSGPMVILNAAESRCDALIILTNVENAIHVPLPKVKFAGLRTSKERILGHIRNTIPRDEREGKPLPLDANQFENPLSYLWTCVVKPVLNALAFSTLGNTSRIFWCPTGPFSFLPIHAAGLYDARFSQPGHKIFDFVISSYVPTLSILASPPEDDIKSSGDLCLLTVPQPSSDGLPGLPGVDDELKYIKTILQSSAPAQTILTESSVGTVEEVLGLMQNADWVHFACHGIQDAGNPTESGLCLADQRRLKLSDIITLSRPHGGLAFLSACQTARGDEKLSEEAIHIAAGMLFAGYGGVIGTMWSIKDRLAPVVARDVYKQLFQNGTRPDYREAAQALHGAIGCLRNNGKVSFAEWLPFIHIGL